MKNFINPTIALCNLDSADVIRTSQPMAVDPEQKNDEDLAPARGGAAAATVNPVKPEPNSLPH